MSKATLTKSIGLEPVLYMALELSSRTWKVMFTAPCGTRRVRNTPAREVAKLLEEIARAKAKLGLPADARVLSCYEAGRDGHWLHRALTLHGVDNLEVDSASIEVNRRARRAKTDRIDVEKLGGLLRRHHHGERGMWAVVRVPPPEAEDIRQLSRTIERLKTERSRLVALMKSHLATQGVAVERVGGRGWAGRLAGLRDWRGAALRPGLKITLELETERLAVADDQLARLKAVRAQLVAAKADPISLAAARLAELRGIAEESSFVFAAEVLGWRTFDNRKQLAGAVGLGGCPYRSGDQGRDQGISKAGNRRMRAMMVEIAWCWLRYQPQSALSRWWRRRFAKAGGRARRVGIVALARRLLIALWRWLEHGVVPEGAVLKTPASAGAASGGAA